MRQILAALLLLGLLTGCTSTATDDARPSLAETQQSNGAVVPGYALSVPKLGIDRATMVSLGTNADGSIQTPPVRRPEQLGVYAHGPMPGAVGPSVVLGHINGGGRPGAFLNLTAMKVGDTVSTTAPDGSVTIFVVYKNETMLKSRFRSAEVYSDTSGPELRLISCTGGYDATGREYDSNVVIFLRKA